MDMIVGFLIGGALGWFFGTKSAILCMGVSCANTISYYKQDLIKRNKYDLDEDTLAMISGDLSKLQKDMRLGKQRKMDKMTSSR